MTNSSNIDSVVGAGRGQTRSDAWHLWRVLIPRRSITGRPVLGQVWRRHDGRRWIYKKFIEYAPDRDQ